MDAETANNERRRALEDAAALSDLRRHAEAIERLRGVLAGDPHDLDGLALLGEAQLAEHDPDAALATATTAIELDPERDLPHRQASIASSRRGLHRQAIAHAEEAVRLAPAEPAGFLALARALLRAKRDLCRARRSAIEAMVMAPDFAEAHLVFGMIAAAEREDAAAEAALRRALTLDPANVSARNELARLSLRRLAEANPGRRPQGAVTADTPGEAVASAGSPRALDAVGRVVRARLARRRPAIESTAILRSRAS
jgi:tetratricopeptide (TPR) repeat protein